MKRNINIISLGCPRNLVDSENIITRLQAKNYNFTDLGTASIALVNTCSFIKEAKQESIDIILDLVDLKKQGRLRKIIVYGCLPQRYGKSLVKELKEVDAFCGCLALNDKCRITYRLTPRHLAYVKICEGCINNCSYCIISKIKGQFKSRSVDSILKEISILDNKNTKEIILIGQDISAYGADLDKGASLSLLLKRIINIIKNIKWVRLLYLHPLHIDDELIDIVASHRQICKYVDLPIQHINDGILKMMNRKITKKQIISLVEKIRKKIPGVAIRTSLIVGFPQETDREFKELLDFVRQIRFERLGVFIYSREEGTAAYNFKGQVPFATKKMRFDAIMSLQQEISQEENSRLLNKTMEVLVDEKQDKNVYLARSQADAPEVDGSVYVRSNRGLLPGDFVKVNIIDTQEYDLVGDLIKIS